MTLFFTHLLMSWKGKSARIFDWYRTHMKLIFHLTFRMWHHFLAIEHRYCLNYWIARFIYLYELHLVDPAIIVGGD